MDDSSTTTTTLDQAEADEDILTYTVSDEALEAAAGTENIITSPIITTYSIITAHVCYNLNCC